MMLGETMTIPRPHSSYCGWKALLLLSLLLGLGFAAFLSMPTAQASTMNLIALPTFTSSRVGQQAAPAFTSPYLASPSARYSQYQPQVNAQVNRPQVQVNALPSLRSSYIGNGIVPALSASSMARSQMQVQVNSAMNSLNMYGLGDPLAKFGLTVVAARNDPSLTPLVREEFFNMDANGQRQVMNLRRDVIVRAASLDKDTMAGKSPPLGFWDPLGFSNNNNMLWFYREAEVKHGRVAMLAVVGMFVSDKFHPFFGDAAPYTDFIQAHRVAPFWPALLLAAGFIETMNGSVHDEATWESRAPGDFGFDPLNMKPKDAKGLEELQTKELNNGRLAMFAAMGLMVQELTKNVHAFPSA